MEELYQKLLTCSTEDERELIWNEAVNDQGLPFHVWKHYVDCRDSGTSPSLAEQFALGVTPQINGGDTNLWRGWTDNQFGDGGMGQHLQEKYRIETEKAGINTVGRRYLHQLAERPNDPKAWVASSHDIQRVCEERGFSCEGIVNVKGADKEELSYRKKKAGVVDATTDQEGKQT